MTMPRKGQFKVPQHIEVEGNKGGSFVHLAPHEQEGMCCLQVGHDCVMRIPYQEIEVTRLAELIADAFDRAKVSV
jgi:hypothetical protein